MIVLTNPKGWHAVLGDRLIPVGGDKHFRPHDKTQVTFVAVSDKQLAGIKAKFAQ